MSFRCKDDFISLKMFCKYDSSVQWAKMFPSMFFNRYHFIYCWLSFIFITKNRYVSHVDFGILLKCIVICTQSHTFKIDHVPHDEFFVCANRIFWLSTNFYDVLLFPISCYFNQFNDIFFMHTKRYFETPNHNEYHDSAQFCIVHVSP